MSSKTPTIIRDKKGRIVKPIPQDTNKNGTAGRPCEFCERAEELMKTTEQYLKDCREAKPAKTPFMEELADILDCDADRVSLWARKEKTEGVLEHPEFYGLWLKVKNLKKLRLLQRILGRYNPTGGIFQLKTEFGMVETEKHILGGDMTDPLKIIITEERAIPTDE